MEKLDEVYYFAIFVNFKNKIWQLSVRELLCLGYEGWFGVRTQHEERRGQVDAYEFDAQVHGESEGCCRSHHGRDIAQQPQPRLRTDPVRHHAGCHGKHAHDDKRGAEVRDDRAGVAFQLDVQGSRREARHADVLEQVCVRLSHDFQEFLLPSSSSGIKHSWTLGFLLQ